MDNQETMKMSEDAEKGQAMLDESAPPVYDGKPPPNYSSIYGRVKEAKSESSGSFDFFKKMAFICLGTATVGCLIFLGIILAIPIASMAIGSKYLHQCPKERYIPIFLIVWGVFAAIMTLNNLIFRCKNMCKKEEDIKHSNLDGILSCFLLAWFIAGSVWVYRTHRHFTTEDPTAADYCHPTLYWFAFWLLTVSYILMALSCLGSCCAAICASKKDKE